MCLDEPGRVVSVDEDGTSATVDRRGRMRHVSLVMLRLDGETVRPGDWILANSGIAVRVIDEADARDLLDVFERAEVPR